MTGAALQPRSGDDEVVGVVGECYRCGYALHGIADDQPCPECGLLAARSRRATDELHDTRPTWLRRLSRGTWVLLLAVLVAVAWPFALPIMNELRWSRGRAFVMRGAFSGWEHLPWAGLDVAAILLIVGVWLLTTREGYPPADRADRRLRAWLRVASFAPLLALALAHLQLEYEQYLARSAGGRFMFGYYRSGWSSIDLGIFVIATFGCIPLPLLLFRRLRGLATRARSAHLAEHCTIVGVGTSVALLYVAAFYVVMENANEWFGPYWTSRSTSSLVLILALGTSALLFVLWSLYLLTRFGISFAIAARRLRGKWRVEDRSVVAGVNA